MNDLISRAALINYIKAWDIGNGIAHDQSTFIDAVNAQEVVDAVEVVRCKDCKHWGIHKLLGETEKIKACTFGHYFVGENGYCVYGERK